MSAFISMRAARDLSSCFLLQVHTVEYGPTTTDIAAQQSGSDRGIADAAGRWGKARRDRGPWYN